MIEVVREGIVVVGTAHISATSVIEVEQTIRERKPAKVLVELDARRLVALQDPEAWHKTDIIQVLREGKQHLFMLQLYLASVQAQMGRETGVVPGSELLKAIQVADEVGAQVVLIDRDISVTLKRGFAALGFWTRLKLFSKLWLEFLTPVAGEAPKLDIEALLKTDVITQMTEEFAKTAPGIKYALIDERDAYMASHIHEQATGASVVAVVGAGHVPGIKRHLAAPADIPVRAPLELAPPKRLTVGKVIGWAIPMVIVGFFVYLALDGRFTQLKDELSMFVLITGGFSALGCALAMGHPLSILTAFFAAPIGVLHPLVATGWFSGLVEAKVRTPKVADFEAIKKIETLGEFWRNGVVRILLVTALTNVGAMISTTIVGYRVYQTLGGP